MFSISTNNLRKLQLFILFFLTFYGAQAQQTSGTLQGYVVDENGEAIAGAIVLITQTETQAKYNTLTQNGGFFLFNQLPPSTKYKISVSYLGYKTYTEDNISIGLGSVTQRNISLQVEGIGLETVVINLSVDDPIKNPKKGNETTLSGKTLDRLPSLNRSFQDATRLMPESNQNSFGGGNYRFNNLSIDGLATNDVLGFQEPASGAAGSVASGTPGGLAGTQPIGYGAIDALAVKIAPFDVSLGNFTGASINAVTKSGTNQFKGTIYGFGRNKHLIGRFSAGELQPDAAFSDFQGGFGIGGPIVKNKLFFFGNFEYENRSQPVLNAPGSSGSNFPIELVKQISDTLKARFNYDPGTFTAANLTRNSKKIFFRLDYNISDNHKLTVRDNYVVGTNDNLEWSQNFFSYGNQGYNHKSKTNSIVAELKSTLNNKFYNKLTVGNTTVNDNRDFDGNVFPHIEINFNTSNTIFAGTYREAAVYGSTLSTTQLSDNLTYYSDKHTITAGASLEFNTIEYRFLTAFNGRWQYNTPQDFFNNRPSRIRGVYNVNNNDFDFNRKTPSADFSVLLFGLYLQDEFRISRKFTLQTGLRMDLQNHIGDFPLSTELTNTPQFADFKNQINTKPQINPRASFNWILNAQENLQLRGGTGLFTGRIPFLWYAYAHYISGTNYFNVDIRPTGPQPLVQDLSVLANQQPGITEINLVDNGFKLPRDWKSNLALDIKLENNFTLGFEATYSKVLQGLLFQSINRKDSVGNFTGADNRSYFLAGGDAIKLNKNFTNVFLLTNTQKGYRYNLTFSLNKSFKNLNSYVGYTFGESKDITSTVRNSHAANFEFNQAINANNPNLSFSNFDLRHKIVTYHFFDFNFKSNKLNVGFIYNGRSGSPYSFIYDGDINRDGSGNNDLIFIPAKRSDIVLADITGPNNTVLVSAEQQWMQLNTYIENNQYLRKNRGKYAERNAAKTPWNHLVDIRFNYEREIRNTKNKLGFTLDILNAANLIDRNAGKQHFVPNVQNSGVRLIKFRNIVNNQPVYQFENPNGDPFLIDPATSRWQMQAGLSYTF